MQTNSIETDGAEGFKAKIQCDGSDRRRVVLPNGHAVETTNYVADEFMVLATPLHAFTGKWDFAFRLNSTLDRTTSKKYAVEDQQYLLKTLVPITWPLQEPWHSDLFGVLDVSPELGNIVPSG
jgi:hypothetical protein